MNRSVVGMLSIALALVVGIPPAHGSGYDGLFDLQSSGSVTQPIVSTSILLSLGGLSTAAGACAATECMAKKEQYFDQNERAVRSAFALGGGKALDDLVVIYRVHPTQVAEFGRFVRASRSELLSLLYLTGDVAAFDLRLLDAGFGIPPQPRQISRLQTS